MTDILWNPARDGRSRVEDFQRWVAEQGGPLTREYDELWRWSVEDLDAFWLAVWRYFDIPADEEPQRALADEQMPGATWFPGARLNYAETMLRMPERGDDDVVVIARSQSRPEQEVTAAQLRDLVARVRRGLQEAGVTRGDRVAAYLPNVPETLAVLLATASLGAVFSSCAPEFGTQSVTDRLSQVDPKVLFAVDGYRYGTKGVDRRREVAAIRAALPSVTTTVLLPYLDEGASMDDTVDWADFTSEQGELAFDRVPFDHPLYILFSSGTTGLPKPILHGHGGITIEHLKALALGTDVGPRDRFFWFTTTGWMMWNYLVSGLGVGTTIVLFDGNPAHPDLGATWRLAAETGVTYFGTSAPFLLSCRKEGMVPREIADLSKIRGVGSTGAPLPEEGFRWVYDAVASPDQRSRLLLGSLSGGTDVCTGFVGASPLLPVVAGEISGRLLGCAVAAYDEQGQPVTDRLGELVIEKPMPSMPVGFWGDEDGSRYRSAYFEDFPGVWRHGDWITISNQGTCTITGRSDATLNRGGVRLGTAEFYTVVEALPEVQDSLVVHLEDSEGGAGTLVLIVSLVEGRDLDDDLRKAINTALRTQLSPRHVPDVVHQVSALPRTLSGKRIEVPVKRILQGRPTDEAVARGALSSPEALPELEALRDRLR